MKLLPNKYFEKKCFSVKFIFNYLNKFLNNSYYIHTLTTTETTVEKKIIFISFPYYGYTSEKIKEELNLYVKKNLSSS